MICGASIHSARRVLLSTYQGMSHGQIAEHTGLQLGTVKTYARLGLMLIRESLKGRPKSLDGMQE